MMKSSTAVERSRPTLEGTRDAFICKNLFLFRSHAKDFFAVRFALTFCIVSQNPGAFTSLVNSACLSGLARTRAFTLEFVA